MRAALHTAGVTILTLIGAAALALTSTMAAVASAARSTVLIMGGSGDPLTTDQDGLPFIRRYTDNVVTNFVSPAGSRSGSGIPSGPYNAVAVITPEQFNNGSPSDHSLTFDRSVAAGVEDLDTCINSAQQCGYNEDLGSAAPSADDSLVVFGYSQSSTIASFEKDRLANLYAPGEGPDVSFILTANGNRPNGGYLARGPKGLTIPLGLPGGGLTFSGPTRTDTQYSTIDIAIQYDGWADQPINPLNLLAIANANAGQQLLHPHYSEQSLDQPGIIDQGQYGDTHYLMVATDTLPLLNQLAQTPVIGHVLADILDAPLRVIIESAYDRTTSPGVPRSWSLLPAKDPLTTAVNLVISIPTGIDNGFEDVLGIRPFGTQRPGPFGVGGPSVTYLKPGELEDSADDAKDSDEAKDSDDAKDADDTKSESVTLVKDETSDEQQDSATVEAEKVAAARTSMLKVSKQTVAATATAAPEQPTDAETPATADEPAESPADAEDAETAKVAKPVRSRHEAAKDSDTDAKTDTKAGAKTDAKTDTKADAKTDRKTDTKADAKTDAKSGAKTDTKADTKTDRKTDAKADRTRSATDSKPGPKHAAARSDSGKEGHSKTGDDGPKHAKRSESARHAA